MMNLFHKRKNYSKMKKNKNKQMMIKYNLKLLNLLI